MDHRSYVRKTRRQTLAAPVAYDRYLMDIGDKHASHWFLAGPTQGVYLRQVEFLAQTMPKILGKPIEEISVLDWGTGKGHISYLLRKRGFRVTSCDLKAETDKVDSTFKQSVPIISEQGIDVVPLLDPVTLPFADGTFDLVVSFGVLEHVQNDVASVKEIARVLKNPGALFICFLPYTLSWTQRLAHLRGNFYHDHLYSIGQVTRMVGNAGLVPLDIWHGQLLPKNRMPLKLGSATEVLDRAMTEWSPLKVFATNLEAIAVKS